ncbi:rxt2 protein [Rutstroemia sp. NJR-2017a BBW]|nr:rxt2 protein [Rutstroemia sp. NJR-2017a BBW]
MASQAVIFADTIAAMKKAVKRKSYDSSIERLTNRGNKLRKRARYVHQGQLAPPTGPQVYRETIEYAGYTRDIISRKPPLVDEDGYEIGSDEDEERAEAIAMENAEFDPYADIKLEGMPFRRD